MPGYVTRSEVTEYLKIDTRKPLTDEQWEAYLGLSGQEVITEADVQTRQFGINRWTATLIKKYLPPFSLGYGHPSTALGMQLSHIRAKNRYRRSDIEKAWKLVPQDIREERDSLVRGW